MQNFVGKKKKKKKTEKPCRPIKFLQRGLQEICAFLFTMTITLICDHIWMSFWSFLNVDLVVRNVPFFLALHIPSCIYFNWTIHNPVMKCLEGTEGFRFTIKVSCKSLSKFYIEQTVWLSNKIKLFGKIWIKWVVSVDSGTVGAITVYCIEVCCNGVHWPHNF